MFALRALACSAGVAMSGTPAFADELSRLEKVDVTKTDDTVLVHLTGTQAPVFTSFTLHDPFRVVVDWSGSRLGDLPATRTIRTRLVKGVELTQFGSESEQISRIVIRLAQQATYRVRANDSTVTVRFNVPPGLGPDEPVVEPESALAAESERENESDPADDDPPLTMEGPLTEPDLPIPEAPPPAPSVASKIPDTPEPKPDLAGAPLGPDGKDGLLPVESQKGVKTTVRPSVDKWPSRMAAAKVAEDGGKEKGEIRRARGRKLAGASALAKPAPTARRASQVTPAPAASAPPKVKLAAAGPSEVEWLPTPAIEGTRSSPSATGEASTTRSSKARTSTPPVAVRPTESPKPRASTPRVAVRPTQSSKAPSSARPVAIRPTPAPAAAEPPATQLSNPRASTAPPVVGALATQSSGPRSRKTPAASQRRAAKPVEARTSPAAPGPAAKPAPERSPRPEEEETRDAEPLRLASYSPPVKASRPAPTPLTAVPGGPSSWNPPAVASSPFRRPALAQAVVEPDEVGPDDEAEPERQAEQDYDPGPRQMKYIGFRQMADISRIFVRMDGKARYRTIRRGSNFVLELVNTSVPVRNNRRPLDTSYFNSPVMKVQAVPSGGNTRIEVRLRERVPFQVKRIGTTIAIDFTRAG